MIPEKQEDVNRARGCELCLNKQAVWYCASDDAFLCHGCDASVHSANHVATKHERVCLSTNDVLHGTTSKPVWHSGFRRKARTPRSRCEKKIDDDERRRRRREDPCVPEIGGELMFFIPDKNDDDDLTSLVPEFQGFFLSNHEEDTTRQFNFGDAMEDLYYNEQSLMSCNIDYGNESNNARQRNMLLRLNYENVIAAWDKQGSSTRIQTQYNFQLVPPGIEEKKVSSTSEREARVWRYRDKRKHRLFEKKIRYEVRKVNADKRPRMKGRFVRRSLPTD